MTPVGEPPATVVKNYPPRGPLHQYRLNVASPFWCFRCGSQKKSKLWALYGEDWTSVLCNGCYGRLLSIYEVKAGTQSDDVKADALAELLVATWTPVEAAAAFEAAFRGRQAVAEVVTDAAKRFVGSAELMAAELIGHPSLDWSGVVIGYCKAVEVEFVSRVIDPLAAQVADLTDDLRDKDFGRVARYLVGQGKPPELGGIRHFLATAASSKTRAATSPLLQEFAAFRRQRPRGHWLVAPDGATAEIGLLTEKYRNPAAHLDEVTAQDYEGCRSLVMGDDGVIENLIRATT